MSTCPPSGQFAEFILGNAPEIATHVAECFRCSKLARALQHAYAVDDVASAAMEGIARSRAAAEAVSEVQTRPAHEWARVVFADSRLHSPEGVRQLLAAAKRMYAGGSPRRALELARIASILTGTALHEADSALQRDALKDHATYLLKVADDPQAALLLLDQADKLLASDEAADDHSRAVLAYARAFLFGDAVVARWPEALDLLDVAEPIFTATGDAARARSARHLRAAILARSSRYEAAAELYLALLREEPEPACAAKLESDLAECLWHLGRAMESLDLVDSAVRVFAAQDDTRALAHALGIRGEALSHIGEHAEALRALETSRHIFASAALMDDEMQAELRLIRATRAADPEAPGLASRLRDAYLTACALDAAQPLRSGATRAAVWADLQSLHDRAALSDAALDHAADFLRTVGRGDEAKFQPLQ